jgi:ribosomal protein S27E
MGFLRPIIPEVVRKFLDCGNLAQGFARVRCPDCAHEYLVAFSCRGRWFCPSCHQKKVLLFGEFVTGTVVRPVPHRHYVFAMPIMLRAYFKYDRGLLPDLCAVAHESLLTYMRTALQMPRGVPGVVMAIHTFGEYLDFHPHLHVLATDGLFGEADTFHMLPVGSLKPLEAIFREKVLRMLVDKGRLPPERAEMLRKWKHSGFNVYHSDPIAPEAKAELERVAQYIIRNSFSVEKMTVNKTSGMVLYRSKMSVKTNRNFEIFEPTAFIAAATQHIPDKGAQMVRYYGYYSNKSRGMRAKRQAVEAGSGKEALLICQGEPLRRPTKKWRELIRKVWEQDPLLCPNCGGTMRIVALIDQHAVVEKILRHLGLWTEDASARAPPAKPTRELFYEPWLEDPFPDYDACELSAG